MFYCGECQKKKEWPESMAMSHGKCEVCGKVAVCFDVPSSHLPLPPVPGMENILGRRLGPVTSRDPAELVFDIAPAHKTLDIEVRGTVRYVTGTTAMIEALLDGVSIGYVVLTHPETLDGDDKPEEIDNYFQQTFRFMVPEGESGKRKLKVKLGKCKWSGPAVLKVKDITND